MFVIAEFALFDFITNGDVPCGGITLRTGDPIADSKSLPLLL